MFFNYRVTENVNEKRKTHVKIGCVCFFVLKDIVGTQKKKKPFRLEILYLWMMVVSV